MSKIHVLLCVPWISGKIRPQWKSVFAKWTSSPDVFAETGAVVVVGFGFFEIIDTIIMNVDVFPKKKNYQSSTSL